MIKLEIVAEEPFTFLVQEDGGNVEILFTRRDLFENNRKRELQRWSPALAVIEKAGLIKITERTEEPLHSRNAQESPTAQDVDADRPAMVKKGRPPKSDRAE